MSRDTTFLRHLTFLSSKPGFPRRGALAYRVVLLVFRFGLAEQMMADVNVAVTSAGQLPRFALPLGHTKKVAVGEMVHHMMLVISRDIARVDKNSDSAS